MTAMNKLLLISLVVLLVGISTSDAFSKRDRNDYTKNPYRIVCYFDSWAHYRKIDPFRVEDIDVTICTHLNYAFANIDENNYEIQIADQYLDGKKDAQDLKGYQRFVDLRKKNPHLTTMLSLGGWKEGSEKFSDMAKSAANRKVFIASVMRLLKEYDFDGLDIDWEFPGMRRGDPAIDKKDLVTLVKELREAFTPEGYVLTAAVSGYKEIIDTSYQLDELSKYVDWFNIMAYSYWGDDKNILRSHSPLYKRPEDVTEDLIQLNVNFTVNYFVLMGVDKKKLVLGLPFYGESFLKKNASLSKVNDPAIGRGPEGFISGYKGYYGYNEICQLTDNSDWTHATDPYSKVPYAFNKEVWIGYENADSIACKVSFLKQMGLSGGFIYGIEDDDFKNRCGGGKAPLLHKVYSLLNGPQRGAVECKL